MYVCECVCTRACVCEGMAAAMFSSFPRESCPRVGGPQGEQIVGWLSEIFSSSENLSGVCPEIFENSFDAEAKRRAYKKTTVAAAGASSPIHDILHTLINIAMDEIFADTRKTVARGFM